MTYSNVFAISSILLYLLATAAVFRSIFSYKADPGSRKPRPFHIILPAVAACFLHAASLAGDFWNDGGINFSLPGTASLVVFLIVTILLTTAITRPVEKLGIVVFPLAALVQILYLLLPRQVRIVSDISTGMEVHILSSILAFSMLNIAAIQAILLAFQDRQLHRHGSNPFIRSLPPLQTMEALLFQMIGAGLILLTVSLSTGFIYVQDLMAQHLAHKTILSVFAWVLFAALLIGRTIYGWRGQTAIRWTLGGFASLMLAYFGSRLVLEVILQRA